jgi:molybdopterin converting factor small subunit
MEGADPAPVVTVRIPAQIRMVYGAPSKVQVHASTILEAIHALDRHFPGMGERLMEPGNVMRRWVNVFVGTNDIRDLQGEATALREGDEVTIMPSAAGGNG